MDVRTGSLKRLLIVGGGFAGWMTAAYLQRALRGIDCTVTLVESVKLSTLNVAEPTDPALVRFVREMRIEETELMQQCSATYQLGTRYVDWMRPGHYFWLPFGLCGGTINDIDLFHFWLRALRQGE